MDKYFELDDEVLKEVLEAIGKTFVTMSSLFNNEGFS